MYTDFRQDLKDLLKRKGVSKAGLSRLANVHHETIYKFIRGETSMTTDCLEPLFDALLQLPDKKKKTKKKE